MLVPPAPRMLAFAATLMLAGSACSSSDRRDQYYGTDVGADWDADVFVMRDAGADAPAGDGSSDLGDTGEAGVDGTADTAMQAADAPSVSDANTDGTD